MEDKSKDKSGQALGGASVSGSTIETGSSHGNISGGEFLILHELDACRWLCLFAFWIKNLNIHSGQQFDFLNWLYWNLWWQQYTYWNMVHSQSFSQNQNGTQPPGVGTGQQPSSNSNTTPQWNPNIGMGPFMRPPPPVQNFRTRVLSGKPETHAGTMCVLWLEVWECTHRHSSYSTNDSLNLCI